MDESLLVNQYESQLYDELEAGRTQIASLTASLAAEREKTAMWRSDFQALALVEKEERERAEDYRLHADELCTERDAAVARAEVLEADCERFKRDMLALDESRLAQKDRAEKAEARLIDERVGHVSCSRGLAERVKERDSALASLAAAEAERDGLREIAEAEVVARLQFTNWVAGATDARLDPIMQMVNDKARSALASRKEHGNG